MEQFKQTFEYCMQKIDQAIKDFSWHDEKAYAQWLRDSYEYGFNSTRILAQAAAVMPKEYTAFSNRFIAHAAEEKGHEKLLENDLKALGYKVEDLPPSTEMKFFYQSLYYWLSHHGNIMGIFGWIFTLEGAAVVSGDHAYSETKLAHGPKASTFLKVHSSEDPDHLEKAFKTIEALSSDDIELVKETMVQYTEQYVSLLKGIVARQSTSSLQKSA